MEDSEYRSNALEEVFSELSPSKTAIMGAVLQQVGAARAERAAALADSEATYNSLMESQSAEQKRHIEQSSELFEGVAKQAINHLDVFQTRDGDDEDTARWNKGRPIPPRARTQHIHWGYKQPARLSSGILMGCCWVKVS